MDKLTRRIDSQAVKAFEQWFKTVAKKEFQTEANIRDFLSEAVKAGRKGNYYDLPTEYAKGNKHKTYGGIWQALVGVE